MHTNPILISFLSILYYKDLNDHIRQFRIERNNLMKEHLNPKAIKINKFNGKLKTSDVSFQLQSKKIMRNYNKTILNRWCLYITLSNNFNLLIYRKHNILKNNEDTPKQKRILEKLKLCCFNKCSCCKNSTQ